MAKKATLPENEFIVSMLFLKKKSKTLMQKRVCSTTNQQRMIIKEFNLQPIFDNM